MAEKEQAPQSEDLAPVILQGSSVSPGIALGPVHLKDYDFGRVPSRRVPSDHVEEELNRFRTALHASRKEIQELKEHLKGQVQSEDSRIFDTHLAYLKDPIFIADVENLIINQQMNLEAAVAKVISDFNRIFKLVESEYLRERAVDLRDVAIRVLRNLSPSNTPTSPPPRYILAAYELSITDLFHLSKEKVEAVVTEEGGLTSHAAILARSMKIPTVIGIKGLLSKLKEGDLLLVDGSEGMVRINPDEKTRAEYGLLSESMAQDVEVDASWIERPALTRDGASVQLFAACSNHAEVEQALQFKMDGVGLYRTELLFMLDRKTPTEDQLFQHYKKVVDSVSPRPAVFRLLDLDSTMRRPWSNTAQEINPALGVKSIRLLFKEPELLRTQIRAVLRAGAGRDARILVPFVSGVDDFKRVKEVVFEEKWELRKGGFDFPDGPKIGPVIEVPAAALLLRDLVRESEFLAIGLDNLIQYTLAADRGNLGVRDLFSHMHPAILRVLRKIFEVSEGGDLEVFVMGESISQPEILPFLLGVGARRFSVSPQNVVNVKQSLAELELRECRKLTAEAARASSPADVEMLLQRFQKTSSY